MVNRAKRPDRRHLLAAARHPTRRDGAIAIALFLLPWVALILVRGHHLDVGTKVAVIFGLAAVSIGLSTLWVTWAAYRGRPADLSLAEVADQLAIAVGTQWEAEARVRRLNDPYPLPVSWDAADPSLTDAWESLVRLATSGAGWPPPPPAGTWAAGPDDLAGEGGELVRRAGPGADRATGRARRAGRWQDDADGPAGAGPACPPGQWRPRPDPGLGGVLESCRQDLHGWLAAQLLIDYPALAGPPPAGRTESTQAAALLAAGLILPVLDGLDEIPEQVRGPAISRINDALRPGEQVVVTCRTEQYRDAVRPRSGVEVTLRGAAAVQLRPLDAEAVRGYLCDDAAGPVAKARWGPVLAVLGT